MPLRSPFALLALVFTLVVNNLPATELTLMTYNLRLDIAGDGPNQWTHRKEQVAAQIQTLAPDILGVQEALPQQVDYLAQHLDGYSYVGVGRDDAQRAGEFSAIYYRADTSELLDSSTFWLSDTPGTPSFGWGASYRRICTYAHFRNKTTGQTYWAFNTHLDHQVPEARLNGAKLILSRIARLVAPGEPYFLTGDFNATPDSPPIQLLASQLHDARAHNTGPTFGPEATYNDFDTTTPPARRIDYIFTSPQNVTITAYATHSDLIENRYPSDHFPVVAKAQLHTTAPTQLQISADHRHLVTPDGQPFFWLADTAWELFHRLTLDEATHYLDVRAAQGFTVIKAVILAEQDGLKTPNANGDLPLQDLDPTRPNEAYFQHVDAIIAAANARGLTIGLLPTWGDKFNKKWGTGPEIFTPANAEAYGRFLSERYANASVVWILGGDRPPEEPEDFAIINAMAHGIRAEAGGKHLITYHPSGMSSSSQFFHQADWLDFNMFQSGHGQLHNPNYRFIEKDLSLVPAKPTFDGEPLYEYIHINFKTENPRFTEFHSRRAGYWSLLAGALGHTYGHNSVWQMWSPKHHPILGADVPWQEAIYYPGAYQAGYMRKLFESLNWQDLRAAQDLLAEPSDTVENHIAIAATPAQDLIVAYVPHGQTFTLNLQSPAPYNARWFNPRDGHSIPFTPASNNIFDPPADEAPTNDWLLILTP